MKKNKIFFTVLLLSSMFSCSNSQLKSCYSYSVPIVDFPLELEYQLSLMPKDQYCLSVYLLSDEWLHQQVIYRGSYKTNGDVLILKDKEDSPLMKFFIEDNRLVPICAIKGLCGKEMKMCPNAYFIDSQKPIIVDNDENNVDLKCRYGSPHNFMIDFVGKRYSYSCFGIIVSQGLWERIGNQIYLYDDSITAPFVGQILEDRLSIFEDEI